MTSIQLDTPTTGGPPAVKFPEVGTSVVVGIVNVDDYQQHDMKTGEALVWSDGSPKMGKRVTGLVVSADRAATGPEGDLRPVAPGELVTFFCEKGKHYTWKDAIEKHAEKVRAANPGDSGSVCVGDVMLWTFESEKPATQRGYNPQKVYKAVIRRPKPEDGDLADRCAAKYHELKDRPSLDTPSVSAPMTSGQVAEAFGASDDSMPF